MGRLVALVIIAVFVALATISITQQSRQPGYVDIIEEQAKAEAIKHKYEIDKQMYVVTTVTGYVIVVSLCVIGLSYLAGLAYLHIKKKSQYAKPDQNGLLPVPQDDTETAARALLAYHTARIADASRQPVPQHVTYAPRYDIDVSHDVTRHDTVPHASPGDVAHTIQPVTFHDLLRNGRIGRGQPLYLGYDVTTGEGVWGTWRELYSAGLGGVQGSGKTWTAASIVAQSLLHNAQLVLCDPHAGDSESLTSRLEPLLSMVALVAETPDEIIQAVLYAREELERRKTRAAPNLNDRRTLVVVIDEWTALVRNTGNDLTGAIAAITTEGRKYHVYALLLAQRWSAAAAGGSDIRNTLTAHYVHRMRNDEARYMTGLRSGALPSDTVSLQPGQSYLLTTNGALRKVATPYMEPRDLARVAQLLAEQSTDKTQQNNVATSRTWCDEGAGEGANEGAGEAARSTPLPAHQQAAKWTAEELRILAALRSGKTPGEVASELAGARGGQKYQAAARHVADVIRRALEHIE